MVETPSHPNPTPKVPIPDPSQLEIKTPVSRKRSALRALHIFSLVGGIVLFLYLLKQTGLQAIGYHLATLGWGFAFITALSAIRNFARAASWYYAIDPAHRRIGYWRLMNVMLAGEAIKFLTATGPFVAEPAKAAMVRRNVPMLQGLSSVLVENLVYYLTVFIFMLAGLPALAWLAEVPGDLKLVGYIAGASIVAGIGITWLSIAKRSFVMARVLESSSRALTSRGWQSHSSRLEWLASHVRTVEENLYSFYSQRRGSFIVIFTMNMVAHFINVAEVCLILALLDLPTTFAIGFVVEAVTKVINFVFFFVPTRAGVYESGHALLIDALGMTASAGVAIAIIRKLRAFVWIAYGLGVIGLMTLNRRGEMRAGQLNTEN